MPEQEHSLLKKIAEDEKKYDKELDLDSLDIDSRTNSVEYKQLGRHFKSLYLMPKRGKGVHNLFLWLLMEAEIWQ